ncbi:unnamed protein product [Durusdinium trenchii]|uniref:Uncharacterized protein n=1 Tax=Durusdinium trenchii TaxID=1381693 RepID=A0ABP0PPL9_9DINO
MVGIALASRTLLLAELLGNTVFATATNSSEACEDTPGWTNGYTACNNYVPVDPDCHKDGVVCHFYKAHPSFCEKGMKDPWMNCCTCGGGSSFNGQRPTQPPAPKVKMPSVLDWLPGIHSMEKQMGKMKATMDQKLKPFEKGMHEVYAGLRQPDFNAPPELEGNPMTQVNLVVFFIILLVTIATSLGYLLEVECDRLSQPQARSPFWASAMLIASYVLLVPGLTQVIFSFNIVVNVLGHRIDVQPEKGHVACTETITGLVELLNRTGSRTGAVLIVLYAVVVPILKLLLLALGEAFRYSSARGCVMISRTCILVVQSISKWACPDMFAYILLVHLVRLLDNGSLILTAAKLDIGFSCFSVFCVCSTISSLGIRLPELPNSSARTPWCSPSMLRRVTTVLCVAFVILFGVGLFLPCMALRIDERQLYPPNGSVPYSAKPLVESLAIPELLKADISIFSCTSWLLREIGGEANSLFAFAMFGFCVIVLTAADVLLLALSAWRLGEVEGPCRFYSWAKMVRKLAMLDVSIMGVYVITFCMGIYKKQGIVVSTREGLPVLIAAEVMHTLIYWLVSGTVEAHEAAATEQKLYVVRHGGPLVRP